MKSTRFCFLILLACGALFSFAIQTLPDDRAQTARTLFDKGRSLEQQGQADAAIAVYDDIERYFGQDNSPAVREQIARARKARQLLEKPRGNR
ncbi:MAG: hypothetical protein LBF61_01365 [Azoarcus sp.]|jgi:hypothetical protein|nr:hypothetical protein [Azoarcus sp.]